MARLAARRERSHRAFHRALVRHSHSPGATIIELPGLEAAAFPAAPGWALFNTVVSYESSQILAEGLRELGERFRALGITAWSVSVPVHDDAIGRTLARAGYRPAWTVTLMGSFLASIDGEPPGSVEVLPDPTWDAVARCNDRAYGVTEDGNGIGSVVAQLDDPAFHLYVAARDGEPVASVVTREEWGDCYIWGVATVPEERGRGLGFELTRLAKREARARGCVATCGESTGEGLRVYRRTGGFALGRLRVWVTAPRS